LKGRSTAHLLAASDKTLPLQIQQIVRAKRPLMVVWCLSQHPINRGSSLEWTEINWFDSRKSVKNRIPMSTIYWGF